MSDSSISSGPSSRTDAEERLHGAVGVGRDQDQAAGRRRSPDGGRGVEGDAERDDVVAEDGAELIVANLADEAAPAAEGRQGRDGVGRGTAGDFHRGTHFFVERFGGFGVDQRHRALVEAVRRDKGVVGMRQHVDDGIADSHHVVPCFRHVEVPSLCVRRRQYTGGRGADKPRRGGCVRPRGGGAGPGSRPRRRPRSLARRSRES